MTDTKLLNFLESKVRKGNPWVCRPSTTSGYGWRLHETTKRIAKLMKWKTSSTVRGAIEIALSNGRQ